MFDSVSSWLQDLNWDDWITIFRFLLPFLGFGGIYGLYKIMTARRKKLRIDMRFHHSTTLDSRGSRSKTEFYLIVTNKSRIPVRIDQIRIFLADDRSVNFNPVLINSELPHELAVNGIYQSTKESYSFVSDLLKEKEQQEALIIVGIRDHENKLFWSRKKKVVLDPYNATDILKHGSFKI